MRTGNLQLSELLGQLTLNQVTFISFEIKARSLNHSYIIKIFQSKAKSFVIKPVCKSAAINVLDQMQALKFRSFHIKGSAQVFYCPRLHGKGIFFYLNIFRVAGYLILRLDLGTF